jgi:uncharacterized protein with NAD-binding domain and iron-sulfur cluster
MTTPEAQSVEARESPPADNDVAVVGGGVAGMTCALRLAQRGYKVTLYESAPMLGGNASSEKSNGKHYDVYPHLYPEWYANFWNLCEDDLGLTRQDAFEPRTAIKILQAPPGHSAAAAAATAGATAPKPTYLELKNPTTPQAMCDDLLAGVLSPPDMFLVGFFLLDLAGHPFSRLDMLQRQTVNGFLYSRGYATEEAAELHNTVLMDIWSIPSSDTSAAAYHAFVRHNLAFAGGRPFAWLLRGSLQEMLIGPWEEKLGRPGNPGSVRCTIEKAVEVTEVECGDQFVQLTLKKDGEKESKQPHKNVVLAVPAPALGQLVMNGPSGRRIVDKLQELSELRRLRTARILVVNLYFNEKLSDIPPEHVGLARSRGYLTFVDISQLWKSLENIKDKHTVLVLAASDYYAFSSEDGKEWAYMIIRELAEYLPAGCVRPGNSWGDTKNSNIDYDQSWYQEKYDRRLFLNTIDSDSYKPKAHYPNLNNIFFAGDFCKNDVKMATIEGAVVSGLQAAEALRRMVGQGHEITIIPQASPSRTELLALKLALLSTAYGAKAWSTVNVALRDLADRRTPEGLLTPLAILPLLPLSYVAEWWGSAEALALQALSAKKEPEVATSLVEDGLSLAARGLLAAGSYLQSVITEQSSRQPRAGRPSPGQSEKQSPTLLSLVKGLCQAIDDELRKPSPAPMRPPPLAAGIPPELEWFAALGRICARLQSAAEQGSRPPPGSGRYRSWSEHIRRHRAKP